LSSFDEEQQKKMLDSWCRGAAKMPKFPERSEQPTFTVNDQVRVQPAFARSQADYLVTRDFRSNDKHIVAEVLPNGVRLVGCLARLIPTHCLIKFSEEE
jgi:hypothetical protein